MPPSRILVDTNTYLRLAHTIKPLLGAPFGNGYCLVILPELNAEVASDKILSKFGWVAEAAHAENRRHILKFLPGQWRAVELEYARMWVYAKEEFSKTSKVDVRYVAHGQVLGIPVATDDQEMLLLAKAVAVDAMSTLELLRLMLDCGHVTMRTVDEICERWERTDDLPANYQDDCQRLFGSDGGERGKAS